MRRSGFLNLIKLQLNWRRTTKNGDGNTQFASFVIHLFNRAIEISKRTLFDPHKLTHVKFNFMSRLARTRFHLCNDFCNLFIRNGRRPRTTTTHKTRHLISVFNQMPCFIIHDHFDQHISGEKFSFGGALNAVLDFHHLFCWNKNTTELILHPSALYALHNITFNRLFHSGVSMKHVPLHIRVGFLQFRRHYFLHPKSKSYMIHSIVLSAPHKKKAKTTEKINTKTVVCIASLRLGQTTFLTSRHESIPKPTIRRPGSDQTKTKAANIREPIKPAH